MYLTTLHWLRFTVSSIRIIECVTKCRPIPEAAAVSGVVLRLLVCWDGGFHSHWGHGCLSTVTAVCCQVEVYAKGRSLVQRSPTECCASKFDLEISTKRRLGPTRGVQPWNELERVLMGTVVVYFKELT